MARRAPCEDRHQADQAAKADRGKRSPTHAGYALTFDNLRSLQRLIRFPF